MSAVTVRGLHKGFGRTPVLTGLDLTVEEGTFTAILGASGSGKTTLLRVIGGFERADRGAVTLGERVVDDDTRWIPAERRRIGFVPQDGALFPHLTVAANVAFGLSGAPRRDGRVERHLAMVGMGDMARRYPHQLSGGQRQRVALARALVIEPTVVLLDEPFSALDPALRSSVRADVEHVLTEACTTAVLVTHDQDEALSMADRVAVLRGGRIVQDATPEELYTRPVDVDVARFLGDANLVAATIDGMSATTALGQLSLSSPAPHGAGVVLIRPEQLEIDANGGTGRVVACDYYGHDAVIRVVTPDQRDPLVVRVAGDQAVPTGTLVSVRARGHVTAWPAEATYPPADGEHRQARS